MKTYPYINIRGIVAFPETEIFLMIGRDSSMRAIQDALDKDKRLVLIAQRQAENNDPSGIEDMYGIGTIANITKAVRLDDAMKMILKTENRIKIESIDKDQSVQRVTGSEIDEYSGQPAFTTDQLSAIREKVRSWSNLYAKGNGEFERIAEGTSPSDVVRYCRHFIRYFEIIPEMSDDELIAAAKEGLGQYYQKCFDGKRSVINQMVADRQRIMEENDLGRQMQLITSLIENEIQLYKTLQS